MFTTNDIVVYGAHGVCKIEGTEEKTLMGTPKQYLVLKSVIGRTSTFFVPTDNDVLLARIRKPLTKTEVNHLIDAITREQANWISDENERKITYKNILTEGNHIELIKLIKAISFEKKEREANGKRLHASDERFLKDAETLLYGEFQYVLNLTHEQLQSYIADQIKNNV